MVCSRASGDGTPKSCWWSLEIWCRFLIFHLRLWFGLWRWRCGFFSLPRGIFARLRRRCRRSILLLARVLTQRQPIQGACGLPCLTLCRRLPRPLPYGFRLLSALFREFCQFARTAQKLRSGSVWLRRLEMSSHIGRYSGPRNVGEPTSRRRRNVKRRATVFTNKSVDLSVRTWPASNILRRIQGSSKRDRGKGNVVNLPFSAGFFVASLAGAGLFAGVFGCCCFFR